MGSQPRQICLSKRGKRTAATSAGKCLQTSGGIWSKPGALGHVVEARTCWSAPMVGTVWISAGCGHTALVCPLSGDKRQSAIASKEVCCPASRSPKCCHQRSCISAAVVHGVPSERLTMGRGFGFVSLSPALAKHTGGTPQRPHRRVHC